MSLPSGYMWTVLDRPREVVMPGSVLADMLAKLDSLTAKPEAAYIVWDTQNIDVVIVFADAHKAAAYASKEPGLMVRVFGINR